SKFTHPFLNGTIGLEAMLVEYFSFGYLGFQVFFYYLFLKFFTVKSGWVGSCFLFCIFHVYTLFYVNLFQDGSLRKSFKRSTEPALLQNPCYREFFIFQLVSANPFSAFRAGRSNAGQA